MHNARETFVAAVTVVTDQVRALEPGDWTRPSPCEGWDARDVLVHVTGTLRKVIALLGDSGRYAGSPASVEDAPDPEAAALQWAETARRVGELVAGADLDRVVETPWGQAPLASALGLPTSDCAVHAWDIAAAAGIRLDLPDLLLDHVDRLSQSLNESRGPHFGPQVEAPAGASPTDRLMAWLGRTRPDQA